MSYKVSVVIPVYKAENTIRRCVESLVYGKERNIEVILVDDCSPDESWKVCQELEEEFPNVKSIRNEVNSGVSFTRNQGLAEASGKYIAFVDSDDWVSGSYVHELYETAEKYPDRMTVCGLRFIDRVNDLKVDYCGGNSSEVTLKEKNDFFDLVDDFLIQSPCNKLFLNETIKNSNLAFDVNQTMGEDFQFVLNYLEAAECTGAAIIHKPLYYYIRYHSGSLMSDFGFIQNDDEYERIRQLYRITGSQDQARLDATLEKISRNYVYHIARNRKHSKQEKLEAIQRIFPQENAEADYRKQKLMEVKETIWTVSRNGSKTLTRIRDRIRRDLQRRRIKNIREKAELSDLTILSQNCIGGVLYHDMGLQFSSPTVNLFFEAEDFVKFVLNLDHYLSFEFEWQWEEEYPVGVLDDIKVYFMHYKTCREAKETWERRCSRILKDRILVLSTDRENFNEHVFELWKTIPYEKLLFTAQERFASDRDSLYFPGYTEQGYVGDLIADREFYQNSAVIEKCEKVSKE